MAQVIQAAAVVDLPGAVAVQGVVAQVQNGNSHTLHPDFSVENSTSLWLRIT